MEILQTYRNSVSRSEVDAAKLGKDNAEYLEKLTGGVLVEEQDALDSSKVMVGLNIYTPQGTKRASEGDYVIYSGGWFFVRSSGEFESLWEMT